MRERDEQVSETPDPVKEAIKDIAGALYKAITDLEAKWNVSIQSVIIEKERERGQALDKTVAVGVDIKAPKRKS